ncbi:RpiR family transcriptional regulator [Alteribacter lacisalsi]|uniref:RpiR family transcriptional regulator n=1 Tax=Alteribacter lacisalsi TaxID=2045244 RepID=A0A2W0H3H0_9BACI|nr:MurR/RpiR family transcriptional regulator [Alteribacter lacisalsi]PYZ96383.1 RpiR family transcriptional regulator [Alteribacter lacisalsi]
MSNVRSGALRMIAEMTDQLAPSEKKLAAYVIENPSQAIGMTASQLAEASGTSSAAVVRFSKSVGYKGFQQLKIKIAGELTKDYDEGFHDLHPGEEPEAVVAKMTNNSIQTLKETLQTLQVDQLEKAVEAIAGSGVVHFFGVGASHIIAQDAELKLSRINKRAHSFSDFHVAAMHVANVQPGDVVFGISFSGETFEVERIMQLAKKRGATTIGLTRFGVSRVGKVSDILLQTSTSKESTFRSGATSSRIAQLTVIDILFMLLANNQYDTVIKHLEETRSAINFIRKQ